MEHRLSYMVVLLIVTGIVVVINRRNAQTSVSPCYVFSLSLTLYAAYCWVCTPFMAVGYLTMKGRTMTALEILEGDFPDYCDLTFFGPALTAVICSAFGIMFCLHLVKARANIWLRVVAGATLVPMLFVFISLSNDGLSADYMKYIIGSGFEGIALSMGLVLILGGGFSPSEEQPPANQPNEEPLRQPVPVPNAPASKPQEIIEEDVPVPRTWVCKKCGATNAVGKFNCLSCGDYK